MSFQFNFTDIEYSNRRHRTKREDFLDAMDKMILWENWVEIIKPFYPDGKRGRRPVGIETMLRMYLMQHWFNLSDVRIEDAIYGSSAMKKFLRLDFSCEQVPDATTLRKHRRCHTHTGSKLHQEQGKSPRPRDAPD